MKGFIPVDLPTKKYIKAYLISQLGEKPVMNTEHNIGCKLYDILQHKTDEDKNRFASKRYDTQIRVYISKHVYRTRGSFLNATNIKSFNLFVEKELKKFFKLYMDHYIEMLPSFEKNLPAVRKNLGIDIEAWSDDSMKKEYYRHRKKKGLKLLYTSRSHHPF